MTDQYIRYLTHYDLDELQKKVNQNLAAGFKLYGSLIAVVYTDADGTIRYIQAVISEDVKMDDNYVRV